MIALKSSFLAPSFFCVDKSKEQKFTTTREHKFSNEIKDKKNRLRLEKFSSSFHFTVVGCGIYCALTHPERE